MEIGGSFRIPDIMTQCGCILREVGTTNKTHLFDYENAIGEETRALLRVHTSNYRIVGFSERPSLEELVELGKRSGLPVIEDLGSGSLVDLTAFGIHDEPMVQQSVRAGVDVISFSGDKLLGGPQAGLILGKRTYIEKLKKHPLARALRVDKMTIAALRETLYAYRDPEWAKKNIPVLRMLGQSGQELHARAERLRLALEGFGGASPEHLPQPLRHKGDVVIPQRPRVQQVLPLADASDDGHRRPPQLLRQLVHGHLAGLNGHSPAPHGLGGAAAAPHLPPGLHHLGRAAKALQGQAQPLRPGVELLRHLLCGGAAGGGALVKHVIIGTAGHVDHGKTLLVKALTGIDTDRLTEEKKRGITIELGFAHLDFDDGTQAGIVDVPGHEKFIKNMLAGAGGIDLAMLVVAADEGFMPQTVEHLGILSLLGIRDGLVVITKCDMVDPEWVEMVKEDVKAQTEGTFLSGKPIYTVSAARSDFLVPARFTATRCPA